MSRAADRSGSGEVRRRLTERSVTDEAFRESLLADPKGAVERELGKSLPEEVEVVALEETPGTVYLVLPPSAVTLREGEELSERDLDAVAGGWQESEVPIVYSLAECKSSPTSSPRQCRDRLLP